MNAQELLETARKDLQFLRLYKRHEKELTAFLSEVCGEDPERQQELQEIREAEKAILQQALAHVRQVERILDSMPDGLSKAVIYGHYLLGEPWRVLADELGYSCESVRSYMRNKAVQDAQKAMDAE